MTNKLKQILKVPTVLLLYCSILAFFNSWPAFFFLDLGFVEEGGLAFSILVSFGAFIIMFSIPALLVIFIFKENLGNFGLCPPIDTSQALRLSSIIVIVSLPIMFFMASLPSFQHYYSIQHNLNGSFVLLSLLTGLIYYFSEEFLFRGFLLFGLYEKIGFHSYWISNLLFALLHATKPTGETLFAFVIGVALSYLSIKTKSFIPAVLVHTILAISLNIIVIFMY